MKLRGRFLFIFISLLAHSVYGDANTSENLVSEDISIISPKDKAVVAPGARIKVIIKAKKYPLGIGIIGKDIMTAMKNKPPYEFEVRVPADASLGPLQLTAIGATGPGQVSFSKPITIDIEGTAVNGPNTLKVEPRTLHLHYAGEQIPLQAYLSSNGTWIDVRESSHIRFTSSNEKVAIVSSQGMVTGTGAGSANITVSYDDQTLNIPVFIPQAPRGVLKGYGQPENDDLNVLLMGMGLVIPDLTAVCPSIDPKTNNYSDCVSQLPKDKRMPAVKPIDWRDLNGDGFIDYQDAQELVKLCVHPHCGYR